MLDFWSAAYIEHFVRHVRHVPRGIYERLGWFFCEAAFRTDCRWEWLYRLGNKFYQRAYR